MNREEIIKLASMAGFETKRDMALVDHWEVTRSLERFANLVAAAEREACAQIAEEWYVRRVADDIRARGEP